MNNSNCCMISILNPLKIKHLSKEFDVLIENDSFHILINDVLMYYYPVWKYRPLIKHLHKKSFYTLFSINLKFWLRQEKFFKFGEFRDSLLAWSRSAKPTYFLHIDLPNLNIIHYFDLSASMVPWPGFKEPEWTN